MSGYKSEVFPSSHSRDMPFKEQAEKVSASDSAALVKQAVDIVDVIGQVIPLRRAGHRHVGLCPFHHEKTPSFQVDADSQFYYCFGCGSGGDVLSFVMKNRNISFVEALQYLADRYSIPLPHKEDGRAGSPGAAEAARKEREQLYGVLKLAADFFYDQLHHSPGGKGAREYIRKRGLPAEVVERERLGYAPDQWGGLVRYLEDKSVSLDLGVTAGLVARSSKDESRLYDRFRNRLIFPIVNDQGRIVAFGGRSLSENAQNEPKYLNSPETPVYHKGRMLYQLPRAREACRQARQVVLVEGYMDLLSFHARGFHRVVATLGTALTTHQIRLLARMIDEVVLAYDGDDAGERAMLRALPLFLQEEVPVSCVRFPQAMDPDDFLKARGLEGFEKLLGKRQELGAYAIGKSLNAWDGSSIGKTRALTEITPIFEAVKQPVLRSDYLRLVSEKLSLSADTIEQQLRRGKRSATRYSSQTSWTSAPAPVVTQTLSLDESVLRVMIKHPDLIKEVKEAQIIDRFDAPQLREIAETLFEASCLSDGVLNGSAVYDRLPDIRQKELFTRLLMDPTELKEPRVQLLDWLDALRKREIKQKHLDLKESVAKADNEGDMDQVRELLSQIQRNLGSSKKRFRVTPDNA